MDKLPLSVDWFAVSLRLRGLVGAAPAGHVWAFYKPTNVWQSRWCLFNEYGEKVFTLLFQPRSCQFLEPSAALLEVANEWLYHGLGISGVMRLLEEVVEFDVVGLSRVDLAVDFQPSGSQQDAIKRLGSGSYYVQGKQNRVPWFQNITDTFYPEQWRGEVPYDQTWGHKTSDVRWKLYYKSKELRDNAKGCGWSKSYIVDMWRENGFDERNVWRLEVAIHNANSFQFEGERLSYDKFLKSTPSLFNALYTSRFTIRERQGHKDKSNDRLVPFLPVGAYKNAFKVRRNETIVEHSGQMTLLRHLVQDVQTENVLFNEPVRESCLNTIEVIVERDHLHGYFKAITGSEFDEWREWIRVKAYYYGSEYREPKEDNGEAMERALLEGGLVSPEITVPLGAVSYDVSPLKGDAYARRWERLKRLDNLSKQIDKIR